MEGSLVIFLENGRIRTVFSNYIDLKPVVIDYDELGQLKNIGIEKIYPYNYLIDELHLRVETILAKEKMKEKNGIR